MNKNMPVIGRFSNEQIRFNRNSGLKRSDFAQEPPFRVTKKDIVFSVLVLTIIILGSIGLSVKG